MKKQKRKKKPVLECEKIKLLFTGFVWKSRKLPTARQEDNQGRKEKPKAKSLPATVRESEHSVTYMYFPSSIYIFVLFC